VLSTAVPRTDPDHLLAGDFSNIGCAISVYFFSIWQGKPAIGLLTHQWPDRARGFRVDSEILLATPIHSWTRKSLSQTVLNFSEIMLSIILACSEHMAFAFRLYFVQSPDHGKILKCPFQLRFQKIAPDLERTFLLFIGHAPNVTLRRLTAGYLHSKR